MRVYVHGKGKVGRALSRALRAAGARVELRAARDGVPRRRVRADVIVLAVRDTELARVAGELAACGNLPRDAVCVHVAGALDAEVLAPLRAVTAGVAQLHPMFSFASTAFVPSLAGGHAHIQGDPVAVRSARKLARLVGMTPHTFEGLDTTGYHAATALVANGAAALASIGAELLVRSGVDRAAAHRMLGPLLASVAGNVSRLGFPGALTGPVRRGDVAAVDTHLATLRARLPEAVPLYVAGVRAQLPLARAIGDAPREAFDALERRLAELAY